MRATCFSRFLASLAAASLLFVAIPSAAADWDWEGSKAEEITAKGVDALIVRPLASMRVIIGGALYIPAIILASPSGKEGRDGAYDTFLAEPVEYAFDRKLGDF
jgi:hypothetical protein